MRVRGAQDFAAAHTHAHTQPQGQLQAQVVGIQGDDARLTCVLNRCVLESSQSLQQLGGRSGVAQSVHSWSQSNCRNSEHSRSGSNSIKQQVRRKLLFGGGQLLVGHGRARVTRARVGILTLLFLLSSAS